MKNTTIITNLITIKKNITIVPVAQIVELGAATELTLGGGTAGCECLTKPAYV